MGFPSHDVDRLQGSSGVLNMEQSTSPQTREFGTPSGWMVGDGSIQFRNRHSEMGLLQFASSFGTRFLGQLAGGQRSTTTYLPPALDMRSPSMCIRDGAAIHAPMLGRPRQSFGFAYQQLPTSCPIWTGRLSSVFTGAVYQSRQTGLFIVGFGF